MERVTKKTGPFISKFTHFFLCIFQVILSSIRSALIHRQKMIFSIVHNSLLFLSFMLQFCECRISRWGKNKTKESIQIEKILEISEVEVELTYKLLVIIIIIKI